MSVQGEQKFSTEVDASITDCYATITDFDSYPSWSSPIERVAVLERHPDKLARIVEFFINMKIRTLRYVLEYSHQKPEQLTWHSVDGDVESVNGFYLFEKLGPKRTAATCHQAITLSFWVPGPIRRLLEQQALQQSVLEFKAEAERRSKAKASGKGKKPA